MPVMQKLTPFDPPIPFTRPTLDEATIASVGDVLRSGWITSGPKVQEFESELSGFFGGRPVRTFANGTSTMEVALRIAGIGPGDEVITTPISWVATSNVILTVGGTPVFVDIDPITHNIDLDQVEAAIGPNTKAIMPVYLAGLPVDMVRLYDIASRHKLRVIEDAAQALGSSWHGSRIGAIGDLISFSFQANKNLTTIEGGCLVCNNDDEARLAEKYRLQGVTRTGLDGMDVDVLGGKFNLTDVNAAIGLQQLIKLGDFQDQRAKLAQRYFDGFAQTSVVEQGLELPVADFAHSNWHMFQIVLPLDRLDTDRAGIMADLKALGIGTGLHYPPIHLFTLYRERGFTEGMFPIAERIGRSIITLPLFPTLTESDVDRIVAAVAHVLETHLK
ncbi:LPS biosynthesis-like protein [Fluviibacter phosphoraccumulans]|nr:LPS biosynthesis-like protein [Fluviibacter phosphoraccumulans]